VKFKITVQYVLISKTEFPASLLRNHSNMTFKKHFGLLSVLKTVVLLYVIYFSGSFD